MVRNLTIPTQRVDFISPNQFIQANVVTIDANREDIYFNAFANSNGYAIKKFDRKQVQAGNSSA